VSAEHADVVVIGAGIMGLATAYQLLQREPALSLIVVEKEPAVARHQTGRNSGVLHSGVYYAPGSLKARNCREGKRLMEDFCRAEGIPFELSGKVIVATAEPELPRLAELERRGRANGVAVELIGADALRRLEPHAAGLQALHVPEAGVVDFGSVARRLAQRIAERPGCGVRLGAKVEDLEVRGGHATLTTSAGRFEAGYVVNCAGVYADRVARLTGREPPARIVPFRGEYYRLRPEAASLVRHLIYPVPDPTFPFLGVHLTRRIDGSVECGPNAVLAMGRQAYERGQVDRGDLLELARDAGFRRFARRHWKTGLVELGRSYSKPAFARAVQRLVPAVRPEHLEPAPAGIRAQALAADGTLVDDFLFDEDERILNVCNAPSPAATASLNIGRVIAERVLGRVGGY